LNHHPWFGTVAVCKLAICFTFERAKNICGADYKVFAAQTAGMVKWEAVYTGCMI
jgi:hypothetical protein